MPAARSPDALAASVHRVSGACWRAVESSPTSPPFALVDGVTEQRRLEELIAGDQADSAGGVRRPAFFLSAVDPFRYGPYPTGSRFRRAGATPGVFYASAYKD